MSNRPSMVDTGGGIIGRDLFMLKDVNFSCFPTSCLASSYLLCKAVGASLACFDNWILEIAWSFCMSCLMNRYCEVVREMVLISPILMFLLPFSILCCYFSPKTSGFGCFFPVIVPDSAGNSTFNTLSSITGSSDFRFDSNVELVSIYLSLSYLVWSLSGSYSTVMK